MLKCFRIDSSDGLHVQQKLRKTFRVERKLSFLADLWKVALAVCALSSQVLLVLISRFIVLLTCFHILLLTV